MLRGEGANLRVHSVLHGEPGDGKVALLETQEQGLVKAPLTGCGTEYRRRKLHKRNGKEREGGEGKKGAGCVHTGQRTQRKGRKGKEGEGRGRKGRKGKESGLTCTGSPTNTICLIDSGLKAYARGMKVAGSMACAASSMTT